MNSIKFTLVIAALSALSACNTTRTPLSPLQIHRLAEKCETCEREQGDCVMQNQFNFREVSCEVFKNGH